MSKIIDFFSNLLHRNDPPAPPAPAPVDPLPTPPALPDAQAELLDDVRTELNTVIQHYKDLSKDGFTIVEVWDLATSAVASIAHVIEMTSDSTDAVDKKAVAMLAAEALYDNVIAPIDIPYIPNIVEKNVVDPAFRVVFLKLASGAYDAVLKVLNRTGVLASTGPRSMGAPAFQPY